MKFVGQNVRIRNEVELLSAISLLHLDIVVAQSILARDLVTLREVIDSLELVQALVEIRFARRSGPEKVPFMRLSMCKAICLKQ